MRGKFITLEGIDGAGKSTQLSCLSAFLDRRGVAHKVTREPGGTITGEKLRELLLDRDQQLHPETEALLMFGARREHLAKVVVPALEQGRWVICDRFTDATFAYQAGGSGLAWEKIAQLESWTQGSLQPDLTLYFDVTPQVARSRTEVVREADRFEKEGESYFERVRAAYLRRAREFPQRITVIDASKSVTTINKELEETIIKYCL
jgi:dTMP kinase